MQVSRLYHLDEIAKIGLHRLEDERPKIIFGFGTCGMSAGAIGLKNYAEQMVDDEGLDVKIGVVGCNGFCYAEPLVDIKIPGMPRVTYSKADTKMLDRIIEEHLVGEKPVKELAMAQLSEDVTECAAYPIRYSKVYEGIPSYSELPFLSGQRRIVLRNCGIIDPEDIEQYIARGGYRAAFRALHDMSPEAVIDEVKSAGLRGRGGAGFPTGLKWELCRKARGDEKYVICNADEGDPGAYMNRAEIEGDPHSLIEGMIIGAYAMGATAGFIYARAEYPLAIARLKKALAQAKEYGVLGKRVLGTDFSFDIDIREGAGAFVCGEETALMASIEGRRGEPRPRPPFPAQSGLWNKPSNINNVETWFNVPVIINMGSKWFSSIGSEKSKGTKVFSLVGKVNRSGLVEIPFGTSMENVIYSMGGGVTNGRRFKAVQTGGPSGGCIPAEQIKSSVDYETLKALGSIVGSGGLVVMDEDTCMVDVAKFFLDFIVNESCGKCTPCRIGTKRMYEAVERITRGEQVDIADLEELAGTIQKAALCGLGQTAPNPVLTTLRYFRDEYEAHIDQRKCPAKVCKDLIRYRISEDKCTGCTLCMRRCPQGAIVGERRKLHWIQQEKCIKCGLCYDSCSFGAVEKE